jgi:phosphoribosylaminoimidazole-succinocarboxamide synthase
MTHGSSLCVSCITLGQGTLYRLEAIMPKTEITQLFAERPKLRHRKKIAEGKTKVILNNRIDPHTVIIQSKNTIGDGNGKRHHILTGKDVSATETTMNVFRFLESKGLRTHFVRKGHHANEFVARHLFMIPVEVVVRQVGFGSYLKRNPEVKSEQKLSKYVVEFFYKDDAGGDPFMVVDFVGKRVLYYDPTKTIDKGYLGQKDYSDNDTTAVDWALLKKLVTEGTAMAMSAFANLATEFNKQQVLLVDAKFEFGIDIHGDLVLGDVVDNDSWRIWPCGDPALAFDKQVYRNAKRITQHILGKLRDNYEQVAVMTSKFKWN